MGKITRQELGEALRQELDDVHDYIAGSLNAEIGAHMSNKSNPHGVTKAQVGLGNIQNSLQADFTSHASARNPHNTRASDVGAVRDDTWIGTGYGIMGGGNVAQGIMLTLDKQYTDGFYLQNEGIQTLSSSSVRPFVFKRTGTNAGTAEIHRGHGGIGFSVDGGNPSLHVGKDKSVGIGSYAETRRQKLRVIGAMYASAGVILGSNSPGANINNTGTSPTGSLYRRSSDDTLRFNHSNGGFRRVYTSKHIKYGTKNPSGGQNGDIYIQY